MPARTGPASPACWSAASASPCTRTRISPVGGRSALRSGASRASLAMCSFGPRIEEAVEKVGEDVDADENRADHDRATQHRIHVIRQQRGGDVLAKSRPSKDDLGQDGPFQQI